MTPEERAAACLNAQTIFGLDRFDTAEQRATLIRARIVDAIKAALLQDQAEYYRKYRLSLDEALNSGDGTYRP